MKELSYPFRRCSSPAGGRSRRPGAEKGYVLLIVMMMATLLLISLAAAVPNIYVEGQREKEKELIFRGEQYARAIELFHMQFKRYPTSVKELLHTNNMSFLRRRFRDPMAKNGKWRFIHATANGVVLDSKILGPPGKGKSPLGGSKDSGESGTAKSGSSQAAGQSGQSSSQQSGLGMGNFSLSGLGTHASRNDQNKSSSNFFGNNKMVGVYIVGVASTSHKQSIGVFDHRTEYDEWEFLGIPGAPGAPKLGTAAVVSGGAQSTSGSSSQPNSSGGFHLGPSQPSQPSQPGSIFSNGPNH